MTRKPIRVAVIGGGCAALTTAFELTHPRHEGRYEVTVYQLGWRLGGKGASGRGPSARIEEHGLHLWMGFYENAFRVMRDCYEELGRDPARVPLATWQDAFKPAPLVGIADRSPDGDWLAWGTLLPPMEGLPGDGFPSGRRFSTFEYMRRSARLVRSLLSTIIGGEGGFALGAEPPVPSSPDSIRASLARLAGFGEMATLAALGEALSILELVVGAPALFPQSLVLRLLESLRASAKSRLDARLGPEPRVRRVWEIIDMVLATLRGEVRHGIPFDPRGFDAIDDYDCREWLQLNGASQRSVDSGFVRALYDLGFSYEDGDPQRMRISAGQALRGTVRSFFTYRGSFFWAMQAGMGDVVFTPLYEVLARRGVRFEFFHRLRRVRLPAPSRLGPGETPHVEALEFDVQARVRDPAGYRPLVDVHGLPCWPAEPLWDQLEDGARLRAERRAFEAHADTRREATRELRVTEDFDFVVLGVALGAIPHVCADLVERDPRWRDMVANVKTVATQAIQIWTHASPHDLGWPDERAINLSGFVEPFDTWADMRHLLPVEDWAHTPRGLAYFCNVLPEVDSQAMGAARAAELRNDPTALAAHLEAMRERPDYAASQRARVRENAIRFLERDLAHLWPRVADGSGGFRWGILADAHAGGTPPEGASDSSRFDTQFWTANVNPSDRYTLSLPGTARYRISPLDPTYDNLTICGDWTDAGFNAGCVEAAVMSGRLAAHAISQSPSLTEIIGYDHP